MELYTQERADRLNRRARRWTVAMYIAAFGALAGCVACCCICTTATAQRLEQTAMLLSTLGGWFVIFALTVRIFPARYGAQHENNILAGERETVSGVISVEPEVLQIPKSIAICKVVVGSGIHTQRLSVRADKAKLLAQHSGESLTLHTVYGYIAAFEESNETC